MHYKSWAAGLILPLALSACANVSNYRPTIDTKGVDSAQYESDLRECKAYAQKVNPQSEAVAGAVVGALVTAATVALALDTGDYAGRSAGIGAAAGAAEGGAGAVQRQRQIVNNCLGGRGYNVL